MEKGEGWLCLPVSMIGTSRLQPRCCAQLRPGRTILEKLRGESGKNEARSLQVAREVVGENHLHRGLRDFASARGPAPAAMHWIVSH